MPTKLAGRRRREPLTAAEVAELETAGIALYRMGFEHPEGAPEPVVVITGAHGRIVYRVEVWASHADHADGHRPAVVITGEA